MSLQTRFTRSLERRYHEHVARLVAKGVDMEAAHLDALEGVKAFGREALAELERRGLFPWAEDVPEAGIGERHA